MKKALARLGTPGAPSAVQQAVQEFQNPDVEAPVKATEVALGRKLRKRVVRPQEVSLVVLNGNGVTGSASNASYELSQRRYRVVVPPDPLDRNAPTITSQLLVAGATNAVTDVQFLFSDLGTGLTGRRDQRVAVAIPDAAEARRRPGLDQLITGGQNGDTGPAIHHHVCRAKRRQHEQ